MVPTEARAANLRGCAFLTKDTEHLAIARTTDEFFDPVDAMVDAINLRRQIAGRLPGRESYGV